MRKIKAITLLLLLSILIVGCGLSQPELVQPNTEPPYQRTPQRVITVWQNSVETLLALELKDKIIAALGVPYPECIKEEYRSDYESLPLKQFQLLDTEHMLMLQPDFVLGWYSTFTDKYTRSPQFWHSRGIRTYIAKSSMPQQKARKIEDEYQYILDMGTIFGKELKAQELVTQMNKEIDFVQEHTQNRVRPRAMIVELQKDHLMVYGKDTLAGNILTRVNGELAVTGDTINYEQLIDANPEVIFLVVSEEHYTTAGKLVQRFYNNPALQDTAAVKHHRIYITPLFMVYSSATRTYDGIRLIAKGLYPDLYEEVPAHGAY